jgi:hypothetical protein
MIPEEFILLRLNLSLGRRRWARGKTGKSGMFDAEGQPITANPLARTRHCYRTLLPNAGILLSNRPPVNEIKLWKVYFLAPNASCISCNFLHSRSRQMSHRAWHSACPRRRARGPLGPAVQKIGAAWRKVFGEAICLVGPPPRVRIRRPDGRQVIVTLLLPSFGLPISYCLLFARFHFVVQLSVSLPALYLP